MPGVVHDHPTDLSAFLIEHKASEFMRSVTLPETKIAPENRPSQKEIQKFIFQPLIFRGRAVSYRGGS